MELPRGQIDQFHLMLVVVRPSVDQVSKNHIWKKLSSTVSLPLGTISRYRGQNALTDKAEGTYHFTPTEPLENTAQWAYQISPIIGAL